MKSRSLYTLLLALFLSLFVCILVSGAPRMISSCNRESIPEAARPICAYISSTTSAHMEIEAESSVGKSIVSKRVSVVLGDERIKEGGVFLDASDSNGNVLCCNTYMRSVYQSFALGDGFA